MNRTIAIGLMLLVILILAVAIIGFESGITGAAVSGQTKCLSAKAALKFINDKGCVRIYDDPKCQEQGKVEVKC